MTAGFTTVFFGNVAIYRCLTKEVRQEPVYDESRTHFLYMKTTISLSGYLNGYAYGEQQYSLVADGTGIDPQGYASNREQQMRRQLGPRQRFIYIVGDVNGDGGSGQRLFDVSPAPFMIPASNPANQRNRTNGSVNLSHVDLNNGPRCLEFTIRQVTGNETFAIDATFEICHLECDSNGNVPNNSFGILSNRWSCVDGMDANLQTIRTYTGHLAVATANLNAQQLRWIVLPPIVQMMRRDKMEIAVAEDGLTLNWTVTDVEIAMSAPYPARTWNVTHTVGGAVAYMGRNTVSVELTGDSNVNKADLIELALYIITAKCIGVTPPNLLVVDRDHTDAFWQSLIVENIEIIDIIGDVNKIVARAQVLSNPGNQNNLLISPITANIGKPLAATDLTNSAVARDNRPPYDRSFSWGGYAGDTPPYQSPATSITQIFLCYLQNPCVDAHATYIRSGSQNGPALGNQDSIDLNAGSNPPNVPPAVPYTATITPTLAPQPVPNPYTSISHKNAAYTFWQLENLYRTKTMRVQMPIANPTPSSGNTNYAPTSSFIRLSGSQTIRIVRLSAERIGKEPEFPDPEQFLTTFPAPSNYSPGQSGYSGNPNIIQYVLGMKIRPGTPTRTVSGQKLYRAEAEYRFGLSRAPNPGEQLALGNDMWSKDGPQNSDISGALTNSNWNFPAGSV